MSGALGEGGGGRVQGEGGVTPIFHQLRSATHPINVFSYPRVHGSATRLWHCAQHLWPYLKRLSMFESRSFYAPPVVNIMETWMAGAGRGGSSGGGGLDSSDSGNDTE